MKCRVGPHDRTSIFSTNSVGGPSLSGMCLLKPGKINHGNTRALVQTLMALLLWVWRMQSPFFNNPRFGEGLLLKPFTATTRAGRVEQINQTIYCVLLNVKRFRLVINLLLKKIVMNSSHGLSSDSKPLWETAIILISAVYICCKWASTSQNWII